MKTKYLINYLKKLIYIAQYYEDDLEITGSDIDILEEILEKLKKLQDLEDEM